jgi:hypothetical protein
MIRPMRAPIALMVVAILMLGTVPMALGDNLLKNADFKEGSQLWRGDGQAAYLKPDGTEGSELDKDAVPVLRVALSRGMRRTVYQEFTMNTVVSELNVQVQVFASTDFKRSTHAEDYVSDGYLPAADFGFRMMPDYSQRQAKLTPGEWVTAKATMSTYRPADSRIIYFIIPPGEGVIYLKNPSASP